MGAAVYPAPFQLGFREHTGDVLNANFSDPLASTQDTITAGLAAGGQAGAFPLQARMSRVTSANTTDGVRLPNAKLGAMRLVRNDSGQSIRVYPAVGETINGGAPNASVTLATAQTAMLVCFTLGAWFGPVALA